MRISFCGDDDSDDDSESDLEELCIPPKAPPAPAFELLDSPHPDLKVALLRNFFSQEEIARTHGVGTHEFVKTIDDRDDDLVYKHHVWRIEKQLKDMALPIYERLMDTAVSLDAELWKGMRGSDVVFPEIEYIVYDVKALGEPGTISPHCDNLSQVTMVIMLSPSSDYIGGVNFFESSTDDSEDRMVKLNMGDAVFFYGDKCSHWITPVTKGRRVILQMELSRGVEHCMVWKKIFGGLFG